MVIIGAAKKTLSLPLVLVIFQKDDIEGTEGRLCPVVGVQSAITGLPCWQAYVCTHICQTIHIQHVPRYKNKSTVPRLTSPFGTPPIGKLGLRHYDPKLHFLAQHCDLCSLVLLTSFDGLFLRQAFVNHEMAWVPSIVNSRCCFLLQLLNLFRGPIFYGCT